MPGRCPCQARFPCMPVAEDVGLEGRPTPSYLNSQVRGRFQALPATPFQLPLHPLLALGSPEVGVLVGLDFPQG